MSVHRKQRSGGAIRPFALFIALLLALGVSITPMSAQASEDEVVDQTTTSSEEKAPAPEPATKSEEAPSAEAKEEVASTQVEKKEEAAPVVDPSSEEVTALPAEKPESKVSKTTATAAPKVKKLTISESPETCEFTVASAAKNPTVDGVANDGQRDGYAVSFSVASGSSTVVEVLGDVTGGFYYGEGQYDPNTGEGTAYDFTLTGDYSSCGGSQPPQDEPVKRVEFCHATPPATAANGWNLLETSTRAFFNKGHSEHTADIVPPFVYEDPNGDIVSYPGMNWDEEGEAIYDNDCTKVVVEEPCVEASTDTLSYTYDRTTATVTVKDGKSLCDDFTFNVTRWSFDGLTVWPQTFADKGVATLEANQPGASATATVSDGCGQFDAYVGEGPSEGDTLTGPNTPYEEVFINTKASGSDTPYTTDNPVLCEVVIPPVEVVPADVTSSDICGIDDDTITVPSTEGVMYKIDGEPTESGTFPATGVVTVTAEATEGYVLKEGTTKSWTFEFTDEPCETSTPPSDNPPKTDTPVKHVSNPTPPQASAVLPNTGGTWAGMLPLGFVLIFAGIYFAFAARRNKSIG